MDQVDWSIKPMDLQIFMNSPAAGNQQTANCQQTAENIRSNQATATVATSISAPAQSGGHHRSPAMTAYAAFAASTQTNGGYWKFWLKNIENPMIRLQQALACFSLIKACYRIEVSSDLDDCIIFLCPIWFSIISLNITKKPKTTTPSIHFNRYVGYCDKSAGSKLGMELNLVCGYGDLMIVFDGCELKWKMKRSLLLWVSYYYPTSCCFSIILFVDLNRKLGTDVTNGRS